MLLNYNEQLKVKIAKLKKFEISLNYISTSKRFSIQISKFTNHLNIDKLHLLSGEAFLYESTT